MASPPYPLERAWVTDRAKEGWLALNVEPHDVPTDMPPEWDVSNPLVANTARYFDVTNFVSRIKVPTMAAMGFIDDVTPAIGIWTSFNLISAPKEAVPMIDSPHNHQATPQQLMPWTQRSAAWLEALMHARAVPPPAGR